MDLRDMIRSFDLTNRMTRNDPDPMVFQLPFLKKRCVILFDDIDQEQYRVLAKCILYLRAQNSRPIRLLINSAGGDVEPAVQLCDVIKARNPWNQSIAKHIAPVDGVVIGIAHSAAFDILQNCRKRLAWSRSTLLLHAADFGDKRVDDPQVNQYIQEKRREHEEVLRLIAFRSKQTIEILRRWSQEERIFNAKEAKELGLIDKVE